MLHYRTQGFNGYAVKYSPFFDNRLAVASGANFGLVGNGRLYVLELTANGIVPVKWYVGNSFEDRGRSYKTPCSASLDEYTNARLLYLSGSPHKTLSMISPGLRSTRTRSLLRRAMAASSSTTRPPTISLL